MPWATILQHKCVRGMRKDREARLTPQLLTQKLTRSWWWPCCNPRRLCVCAGRGAGGSHASSKSSTGHTPFKLSEATRENSTSSVRSTPAWQIQKMCRICTTAWRSALAYQHHFLERNKYLIHMPCLLYKNVQFHPIHPPCENRRNGKNGFSSHFTSSSICNLRLYEITISILTSCITCINFSYGSVGKIEFTIQLELMDIW